MFVLFFAIILGVVFGAVFYAGRKKFNELKETFDTQRSMEDLERDFASLRKEYQLMISELIRYAHIKDFILRLAPPNDAILRNFPITEAERRVTMKYFDRIRSFHKIKNDGMAKVIGVWSNPDEFPKEMLSEATMAAIKELSLFEQNFTNRFTKE